MRFRSISHVVLGVLLTLISETALASDFKDTCLVRVRALHVKSMEHGSDISLIAGHVDLDDDTVPELDISYFFTPNFAAELVLATSKHDVQAVRTSLGQVDLGEVSLLPPTLTFQYHFRPHPHFTPYLGAGLNYTHFFNVHDGPVASSVSYTDSWGLALQAGLDVNLHKDWVVNFDIKKVYVRSMVDVRAITKFETNVHIDPVLAGVGIGYRF